MTLVGGLRTRRIAGSVLAEAAIYDAPPADIGAFQLERFNQSWADSLSRSPWARAQQRRLDLPGRFDSWDDFDARTPVQAKTGFRADLAAATTAAEPLLWRATGGTTGEPLRFPVFKGEAAQAGHDLWVGRARLGITPADRLFMIWGHAQMFGTGPKAAMIRLKRQLYDAIVGYVRWNAYRMSPADLDAAGQALLASGAAYVLGYSCALDRFARANLHRAAAFRGLNLKAIIATAEGFPREDSRQVIAECFGAPVVMEYGSVESGPIAYERPAGGYDAFWARHRLEVGAGGALIVTSLNPRALPLLRYAIGDVVSGADGPPITRFAAVGGRVNDAVVLPDGTPIHSEAFTHVIRDLPGVRAYQIVVRPAGGAPLIRYEAEADLSAEAADLLRRRLAMIDPVLTATPFERVDTIPLSAAGKHRMVIQEVG